MNARITKIIAVVALVFILAGCNTATPTVAEPTPDTAATMNAITTQAAATIIAEMTLNAPTVTNTPEPTATSAPTNTPEPTFTSAPTNTPAPTATATRAFIPWTPTPTSTQAVYACSITEQKLTPSGDKKKGTDFDASWTIKNTGTKSWNPDGDIYFVEARSGNTLHAASNVYDLPQEIEPGESFTFTTDMKAPADKGTGTFGETWAISGDGGTYCTFSFTVTVVD